MGRASGERLGRYRSTYDGAAPGASQGGTRICELRVGRLTAANSLAQLAFFNGLTGILGAGHKIQRQSIAVQILAAPDEHGSQCQRDHEQVLAEPGGPFKGSDANAQA